MRIRTPDTFLSRMCWPSVLSRQVLLIEEYEEKECDNAPPHPPRAHKRKERKKKNILWPIQSVPISSVGI